MLDADTVVFVEVRYRLHAGFGGALDSIDGRKQKRLVLAASLFLQKEPHWGNHPCRFDVVALQGSHHAGRPLQWLKKRLRMLNPLRFFCSMFRGLVVVARSKGHRPT